MKNKIDDKNKLNKIFKDSNTFIVMCYQEPKEELPEFTTIYKVNGDKVLKYSIRQKTQTELSFTDYYYEAESELLESVYFVVCKGDPLEFIKFIETAEFEAYFVEVAKYDLNKVLLPKPFEEKTIDKYLEKYFTKAFDHTFEKTVDKIKIQQWISWGISIASLGFSIIYNLLIK